LKRHGDTGNKPHPGKDSRMPEHKPTPPLTAEEARAGAAQIDKNLAELFPGTANHTEILSPADPEWGNRHKRQRYRNEGDESPWDGDYAIYDERCPRCRAEGKRT
jgi:hypothetical protein